MRWLSACALVVVGCASSTRPSERRYFDEDNAKYSDKPVLPPPQFAAFRRPVLLDTIGDWVIYRVTALDGQRRYERLALIARDGCGTWVSSLTLTEVERDKRLLCLVRSPSHEPIDQVKAVYHQSLPDGVPFLIGYETVADKKQDVGSIAERLFVASAMTNMTTSDGAHYELVDRGHDDHPRSEIERLAEHVERASSSRDSIFARRLGLAVNAGVGMTTAHADTDAAGVFGVGADVLLRFGSFDILEGLRLFDQEYSAKGRNELRRRTLIGLGARWSPLLYDGDSRLSQGLYVRTIIGEASFSDSGSSDDSRDGYGIETAIGVRVFSQHVETAEGLELAHSMSVLPDNGVQHVISIRLTIEIGTRSFLDY